MDNILDYPEMRKQLIERLQEIGFDMNDWHINTFHATGEGNVIQKKDKTYESCDYIYLINKKNRKDVFYLWVDIKWAYGMEYPFLYICTINAEDVESEIDSLNDNIEDHFAKNYNPVEKTTNDTNNLVKKYSIHPIPDPKDLIKKHVTSKQFNLILKDFYRPEDLKKFTYTNKVIPFIKYALESMSTDGYELAEPLLKNEIYKKGKYFTYAPEDEKKNLYKYNFENDLGKHYLIEGLVNKYITEHLKSSKDAICIAHSGPAKPTDGWIKKHSFNYPSSVFITHKNHLYHLLNNKYNSIPEAMGLIRQTYSFWPVQIINFTYSSELQKLERNSDFVELKDSAIHELGQRTDKMLINAYDFNWYIFWEL